MISFARAVRATIEGEGELRYTTDGSRPTARSPKCTGPGLPKQAVPEWALFRD